MSRTIIGISHRAGASWPSEPTWVCLVSTILELLKNQPRASRCVTNTDKQSTTPLPLRRCRLNLPLRLSASHTTRTRRDPRRGPRPRHAHRTHGACTGRDARGRTRRASYFGSSSSRRRRWCVKITQELAEMLRPTENEAGLTAPRPEVFLRGLHLGI